MLAGVLVIVTLPGCNGGSGTGVIRDKTEYQIQGVLIEDWNRMATLAGVMVSRNDTLLDSALVWIGSQTLSFDPSADSYRLTLEPSGTFPRGTYDMVLADLPDLMDTVLVDIADTFTLSINDPFNRLNPGGRQVVLEWTGSPGVQTYAIAAVFGDSAYKGQGYSAYTGTNDGVIPPEAFRWSNQISLDTGWYHIFAYATVGAPDSAVSADLLPIPLPGNRTANIDQEPISGRFGTIVVAMRDSVYVTQD